MQSKDTHSYAHTSKTSEYSLYNKIGKFCLTYREKINDFRTRIFILKLRKVFVLYVKCLAVSSLIFNISC